MIFFQTFRIFLTALIFSRPTGSAAELKLKRRYEELKAELKKAVSEEDYEKAAKLHKELKSLGDIN